MTDWNMVAMNHLLSRARDDAKHSLDPSTKVGAILAVHGGPVIHGHNQFVGLDDPATATREERYADVVHAEEVVLMRAGRRAYQSTVVTTHEPCARCWRRLIWAGVLTVAFPRSTDEQRERWGCEEGRQLALAHGLNVVEIEP